MSPPPCCLPQLNVDSARLQDRRPSPGQLKLCNLQVLDQAVMHECVVRLLKAQDEDSLELLPKSGTDLAPEEPKVTETEGGGGVTEVKIALFIKMFAVFSSPASDGAKF